MSNTQTVPVDRERMYEAIKKRGLTSSEVSLALGYDKTYITSICGNGKMSLSAAKFLETLYHIMPEEYAPITEKVVQKEVQIDKPIQVQSAIDYEKLGRVIASAVYEAVSKAWNEPVKRSDEK